jgi:hypothetical protein
MRTMVQVQTLSGRPPDETYGPGRYSARQPEPASSREGPKGLRTLRWSKGDSNSWSRSHAALSKTLAPSIVRLRGRSVIRDQEFRILSSREESSANFLEPTSKPNQRRRSLRRIVSLCEGGTEGSNPSASSGESFANLTFGAHHIARRGRRDRNGATVISHSRL